VNDKLNRQFIFKGISETLYEMDDYKGSRDYLEEYFYLRDTIFSLEKTEIIADLKLKYEKEKDQARILALENENLEKDLDLSLETNRKNIYLFTGLGIIIIILFLFIFFRHKARKEKIITGQRIRQLEEEKKVLAAKALAEGQEEERKRIATELHDGLGVLLSATKMQFSSIKDKSPENKKLIDKATELLEQASGDVRKISHNMMPGLLMKYGLVEAVEDLFESLDETESLNAATEITWQEERLPENQEIMFYRIVQELVNNTLKHAEAKNIKLIVQALPGQLEAVYTDDGKGFVVEEKLESRSIGLQSIQSRVNFLNGKVVIESKPGAGVKYIIHIPV
jgi:two-component system NarL family sensor kinase